MSPKTILVVDDSDFDRDLLLNALSRKGGFDVTEANSGEKCLSILNEKKIDLILMDIMMPGAFGTQVLMTIREKFNAIELPIIMVTSKADASDIVGCLQSGANDYITKPVNFEIAISRIVTHLKLAEVSHEMSRLREIAALDAMITTYNHEINNPLAIALGNIKAFEIDRSDDTSLKRTEAALWRIADIIKKIREVTKARELQYDVYADASKMMKIQK